VHLKLSANSSVIFYCTILPYHKHNVLVGAKLEDLVHQTFQDAGCNVEYHNIESSGLDLTAFKNRNVSVAECLCWYGGYIHPKRWHSIISNLLLKHPSANKYLICVGVHPTQNQCKELYQLNIKLLWFSSLAECKQRLRGVITSEPESVEFAPVFDSLIFGNPSVQYLSYDECEFDYFKNLYQELFG
jgi:hypothetical protein